LGGLGLGGLGLGGLGLGGLGLGGLGLGGLGLGGLGLGGLACDLYPEIGAKPCGKRKHRETWKPKGFKLPLAKGLVLFRMIC
jgi:hypothetical protein